MTPDTQSSSTDHTPPASSASSRGQGNWAEASDQEILDADLIIALGLDTLSDEDKRALIDRMTLTVQKAVVNRVLDTLRDDQKRELDAMLSDGDNARLNEFLLIHVPNFAELTQEETIKFKRAMLTGSNPY